MSELDFVPTLTIFVRCMSPIQPLFGTSLSSSLSLYPRLLALQTRSTAATLCLELCSIIVTSLDSFLAAFSSLLDLE